MFAAELHYPVLVPVVIPVALALITFVPHVIGLCTNSKVFAPVVERVVIEVIDLSIPSGTK